jgi:hypothetical protein
MSWDDDPPLVLVDGEDRKQPLLSMPLRGIFPRWDSVRNLVGAAGRQRRTDRERCYG